MRTYEAYAATQVARLCSYLSLIRANAHPASRRDGNRQNNGAMSLALHMVRRI